MGKETFGDWFDQSLLHYLDATFGLVFASPTSCGSLRRTHNCKSHVSSCRSRSCCCPILQLQQLGDVTVGLLRLLLTHSIAGIASGTCSKVEETDPRTLRTPLGSPGGLQTQFHSTRHITTTFRVVASDLHHRFRLLHHPSQRIL